MTKYIIKNIANNEALTIDSSATTWGELTQEIEEQYGNDVYKPNMKAKLRHNRAELASDSLLPTEMDEVTISLFAMKLDAGHA